MVGRAGTRSSTDQTEPTVSVICLGVFCLIGVACRHLLRRTRVPYTVALLIIGIVLGCLEFGTGLPLGKFGDGVQLWAKIDPDLLLALFLPPLLFEGSFSMEVQQIKKCMAQMLFLAGPGVIISTFCIGCALKLALPYEWSWQTSLLLGAVLSATDPVAVVALLKELGTSKKMSTIIEGESMMNDGASIVVYHLFYNMMLGRHFSWEAIVKYLTLATVGALGIGIAFAIALVLWLPLVFNDPMINLSLTLAVSYIVYFTAQQGADVSGILAVVTFGMFLAAFARSIFPSDARRILNQCWEVTAYVANTLIFILSGIIMAEGIFTCGNQCGNGSSWAYLILVYVIVQFSRVIIVILLYPALQYFGYGLTWKEAVLLAWSGLRGAVGLAMALSVKRASSGSSVITSETGSLILFLTTGTVFLTIVLNGSIAQFLLTLLGMGGLSHVEKLMLDHAKYDIWKKYLQERENLCDGELGPVNWPSVENYIRPTFSSSCPSDSLDQLNLIATRVQLLKAVQAAYRGMLDDGSITHVTANFLMSSVDDAIDAASQEPLCDWRILKALIDFQTYAKVFNVKIFPQRLRTYIAMKMMQFACYICVAFLRSHRTARRKVSAFVGETDNMSLVLAESVIEEKEAAKFLEEVLHVFPEVLGLVRTTHVTCSMLHLLKIYVQKFEVEGLLEEKLGTLLHDLLVSCFKKSLNDPLQANNLSTRNVISTHPLLRSLPFEVRGALEGLIKKVINPRDMILCREGSLPQSLLLIQSGLLKFETKSSNSSRSTTRVLAEECILGLYEILSGKPCICDISTDSLVVCYIIEANALFPLLASHPGVENLLWQESVVVLAKLLLPEVFEKVPLHSLRALIADSFSMTTFVREESIVIPENSTVFLLEGVLRNQQLPEVVVEPPALLLASYRSSGSSSSEMPAPPRSGFVHYGYQYQAEMTARLAYIDTSGWSSGSLALPVEHEEMNIARATAIED